MNKIQEHVNNFKTKYEEGFLSSEIKTLLKDYPELNMEKFDAALTGITCMIRDGQIVIYHHDIEKALYCGIENRDLRSCEWD